MRLQSFAAFIALATTPSLASPTPTSATAAHSHSSNLPHKGLPSYETPNFSFGKLYNLTATFLDAVLYPANQIQTRAVNSTFFAPNVLGRVDATRLFNGAELNTEYWFGLFSGLDLNPSYFSLLGTPVSYNIVHFAGNENIVSAAAIVDFVFSTLGNITVPLEIDLWITFNADGQISQYDATLRRLDWLLATQLGIAQKALQLESVAQTMMELTELLATSICTTEVMYCNGTNQQYASFEACFEHLTVRVPFGTTYGWGMNTLQCRMIHQNMVPFRPDVHCPHIGPTGGGYCTDDLTYEKVVAQAIYTNTPFVPYGYQSKNKTIADM